MKKSWNGQRNTIRHYIHLEWKTKRDFLKTINLWKMSGNKVRKDVGKWSDLTDLFGYLYVPENELKLEYEIDEKYQAPQMAEIIREYEKDLFLDSENWFAEMKTMGEALGYCPNVKEYKKNPDNYKGSITDVCTIVRVAVTGKKELAGPCNDYACDWRRTYKRKTGEIPCGDF